MASVYNTFLGIYSRKMKIYVPENYIEECSSFFICSIQKLGIPSNVQKSWSSLQRNVLCCAQSLQLHPSWGTLWTVAGQAPLSMGFSRQEYWSGLPCPPPGDLPNPGIKPRSLRSPALAGRLFTTSATGEAQQGNPTQQWKRRTADAYNNLDPVSVGHRDVLPDAESQTEKHTLWVHVREVLKQANGLYGDSHQISEKEREQRECPAFYTLTGSGGHSCRYCQ